MNEDEVRQLFCNPPLGPSYGRADLRFVNREFMVITYETDPEVLRRVVPEPLEPAEPVVKYEFIRMPDSQGLGDYTESGQVIPVRFEGKPGTYVHSMFLDNHPAIAGGREIFGFPKKLAKPRLVVDGDTLLGTLDYGQVRVAIGTMPYKRAPLDEAKVRAALDAPNYLLKIIPHVDGSPRICELVRYFITDVTLKGAWTGPGALHLVPHANAPVAELPVRKALHAAHLVADLTLARGEVACDYLAE